MRYKIIVVVIAMLCLNGLNNSRELNDLAIVSAIGIDKIDEENYRVSAMILNPSKQEGGSNSSSSNKMTIYEAEDVTIQKAIRKMILESPRKLYLAHMELLLVSENVAKDSLENVLDFFIRDNEGSNDFLFVVAKGVEPREALQIKTPAEDIPTENIVESIKVSAKNMGTTTENVLNDTIEYLLEEGEEIVIPSVYLKDSPDSSSNKEEKKDSEGSSESGGDSNGESGTSSSEESSKIVLVGPLAYFKGNKLQGYLSEEESMAYNMLRNNFEGGVVEVNEEDRLVAEFVNCKSSIKPKYENGEYIVDIEVKGNCNITEISKNINDVNHENINKYEKLVSQKVYTDIERYINNCINVYDSDLVGFGKIFREKLNKEYKKVSKNFYPDIFRNIKTNIKVNIEFPNDGGINKKW